MGVKIQRTDYAFAKQKNTIDYPYWVDLAQPDNVKMACFDIGCHKRDPRTLAVSIELTYLIFGDDCVQNIRMNSV